MKIYLTPLCVIFIPSVTFEPLCILNFMQNIRKKYDFHFQAILKNYRNSPFRPFWAPF